MLNLSRIQVAHVLTVVSGFAFSQPGCFAAESEWQKSFDLGLRALQEGHSVQGENYLKDSLKMEEKQGATEMNRAQSSLALADFYRAQKRFAEAELLYKQLLSKFENSSSGDQLPAVMSKLAGLYKAENKLEESRDLYKKTLVLVEKQSGADSAASATVHANLGLLFQRLGKLKEAEAEELTAINLFQAKLGKDCPESAQCMCDLAQQYLLHNKSAEAIKLLQQALAVYEKKAPAGLLYAACAERLGNAYFTQKRYPEAEVLSRKALEIYQKSLGPASKDTAIALTNLAGRLAMQGKNQEALECYYKSLAVQEKSSDFSPGVLANLHGIAEIYVGQGEYKKAEAILRRDLSVREKKWGPKHFFVISALKNLSSCLSLEGAPTEECDMLLNRAEEIITQIPVIKRRMVAEITSQEMVKGLDANLRKSRKKNDIW